MASFASASTCSAVAGFAQSLDLWEVFIHLVGETCRAVRAALRIRYSSPLLPNPIVAPRAVRSKLLMQPMPTGQGLPCTELSPFRSADQDGEIHHARRYRIDIALQQRLMKYLVGLAPRA